MVAFQLQSLCSVKGEMIGSVEFGCKVKKHLQSVPNFSGETFKTLTGVTLSRFESRIV
jgi:hypothetical protein